MIDITTCDGKYNFKFYDSGKFECLRYGEEWRSLTGDKAVLSLVQELDDALRVISELTKYFTSGNDIPVERATILAKDFWNIVGELPKNKISLEMLRAQVTTENIHAELLSGEPVGKELL